jgi:valyl-tRNA synthetase
VKELAVHTWLVVVVVVVDVAETSFESKRAGMKIGDDNNEKTRCLDDYYLVAATATTGYLLLHFYSLRMIMMTLCYLLDHHQHT